MRDLRSLIPRLDTSRQAGRRRILALYVAAIVGPTLVLLYLGMQAVQRQRHAIEQLSEANRRLQERTLATALEQRITNGAEACLRDLSAVVIDGVPDQWRDPRESRRRRASFQTVVRSHPIASAAFFVENGIVRIPRTQLALPSSVADQLVGTADEALVPRFLEAESLELTQRTAAALKAYERIYAAARQANARALALSRIARCHKRLGEHGAASAAYRRLMEQDGDLYDPLGRPHALVAAVEWRELNVGPQTREQSPALLALRSALAEGYWELDPDAAEYFYTELSLPGPGGGDAPYLQLTALGRALQDGFPDGGDARSGRLQRAALPVAGEPRELFYVSDRAPSGARQIRGVAVDLGYVRDTLLAATALELGISEAAVLREASGHGAGLPETLRWLEVAIVGPPGSPASALSSDMLVFGGAVALVLSVLLLGVVLLLRDVARDASTTQLRADLVGGVSHELKTPLTAIRMYGETLSARPDAPTNVRRDFYDIIVQESDRLTRLVDRVLDFSQLSRGGHAYTFQRVAVLPLVEAVVTQYRPFLNQHGFVLVVEADNDIVASAHIDADREAVMRALVNLLDNAVKYSDDERWICISVARQGNEVRIQVEDRGIGLPAEDRARIFDQFLRGSNRSGRGGYGLGLYLVRHVMTAHGGRIDLWSEPGRGSRFALLFPLSPDADPSRNPGH